jgi:cytidine deaminase
MFKENGNLLDLEPIVNGGKPVTNGLSLVLPENNQTKRDVIQISDDNIVFQANIEAASYRSCKSIQTAGEIFQFASEANKEVTSMLISVVEETKGSPCGQYVEEYNNYLAKMASHNTIEIVKIASEKIVHELIKPPLPPLVNREPKGFLAKLLTG